jgi:hypothetical protein
LHTSGATRGVTLLTLLTLIFVPVLTGHRHHHRRVKREVLAAEYATQESIPCTGTGFCPGTTTSMTGYVLPGKDSPTCGVLTQRIEWFAAALRKSPRENATHRQNALLSSARAFVAAGCATLGGPPIVSGVTVSPPSGGGPASGSP